MIEDGLGVLESPRRVRSVTAERMISYAQNAEDVVLRRAFASSATGFYIDVGASHPVWDSVTKHFYDSGWSGINIEPLPNRFSELERERPRDINLNVGLSNDSGRLVLHEVIGLSALSTFDPGLAQMHRDEGYEIQTLTVPTTTLLTVCQEHGVEDVDFLKIDAEGFEREVLQGTDFEGFRPRVVLAERGNAPEKWLPLLTTAGYVQTLFDGINLWFVREEDEERLGPFLTTPATIALDRYDPYLYVHQLKHAGAEIEGRDAELARLRTTVEALGAELVGLRAKIKELRDEVERQQHAAVAARAAETMIRNSTSWRVTGPLRWFSEQHHRERRVDSNDSIEKDGSGTNRP